METYTDGNYWCYDKHRYGWEVVRLINRKIYRFGIFEGCSIDHFLPAKQVPMIKLEDPKEMPQF